MADSPHRRYSIQDDGQRLEIVIRPRWLTFRCIFSGFLAVICGGLALIFFIAAWHEIESGSFILFFILFFLIMFTAGLFTDFFIINFRRQTIIACPGELTVSNRYLVWERSREFKSREVKVFTLNPRVMGGSYYDGHLLLLSENKRTSLGIGLDLETAFALGKQVGQRLWRDECPAIGPMDYGWLDRWLEGNEPSLEISEQVDSIQAVSSPNWDLRGLSVHGLGLLVGMLITLLACFIISMGLDEGWGPLILSLVFGASFLIPGVGLVADAVSDLLYLRFGKTVVTVTRGEIINRRETLGQVKEERYQTAEIEILSLGFDFPIWFRRGKKISGVGHSLSYDQAVQVVRLIKERKFIDEEKLFIW